MIVLDQGALWLPRLLSSHGAMVYVVGSVVAGVGMWPCSIWGSEKGYYWVYLCGLFVTIHTLQAWCATRFLRPIDESFPALGAQGGSDLVMKLRITSSPYKSSRLGYIGPADRNS